MKSRNLKTVNNNTSISGNTYLTSQTSFSKSLHKSTDSAYMSYNINEKNKKELKMNYLNQQISMLHEMQKNALGSTMKKESSLSKPEVLKSSKGNVMKTKLIPKERFINSSMISNDVKKSYVDKRDMSRDNTNENYLDNELEQLGFGSFGDTIKRDNVVLNTNASKPLATYNSGILELLTKKHIPDRDSPRRQKIPNRHVQYIKDNGMIKNISISPNNNIIYSKNASVPRSGKDFLTYTDAYNKLNNSNITIESKNSETSFNNNIMFTDGGITNINIHSILNCEDIPNEIYFNDKRYKCLQDGLSRVLQDNYKCNETIREMKRTMDILKCYINIQQVCVYFI
jgi:hypothetical protein